MAGGWLFTRGNLKGGVGLVATGGVLIALPTFLQSWMFAAVIIGLIAVAVFYGWQMLRKNEATMRKIGEGWTEPGKPEEFVRLVEAAPARTHVVVTDPFKR